MNTHEAHILKSKGFGLHERFMRPIYIKSKGFGLHEQLMRPVLGSQADFGLHERLMRPSFITVLFLTRFD